MPGEGWGIDIRWARGERGWLEIRDPTDGRIYQVRATDCPRWWRQYATVRLKRQLEKPKHERDVVHAF